MSKNSTDTKVVHLRQNLSFNHMLVHSSRLKETTVDYYGKHASLRTATIQTATYTGNQAISDVLVQPCPSTSAEKPCEK